MSKKENTYHHPNLREALIQETENMLADRQLDAITLNELGQRLGVARSAPYRHFASKGLLFCAVATRACHRFKQMLADIRLQEHVPPKQRLMQMVAAYLQFALDNPDYYRLLFREPLVGREQTPELAQSRASSFEELLQVLQECQDAGVIQTADKHQQALFVWSAMHGMGSLLIDGHLQPDAGMETLFGTLSQGILHGLAGGR